MFTPHEIYDSVQSIGVVGFITVWIYDHLRASDHNKESQESLGSKVEQLDKKLTVAMTKMADQVGSLAQSVSRLEGQFSIFREVGRK